VEEAESESIESLFGQVRLRVWLLFSALLLRVWDDGGDRGRWTRPGSALKRNRAGQLKGDDRERRGGPQMLGRRVFLMSLLSSHKKLKVTYVLNI
jgi:hypothetical protein